MTPLITTSILIAALSITACGTTGKMKAYVSADKPLFAVINELARHPHNLRAQEDLRIYYAEAVARHEKAIRFHSAKTNERRFYSVLHELEALQHIYNSLQMAPLAFVIVCPKDYSKQIAIIAGAADFYESQYYENLEYSEAMSELNNENR